MQSDQQQSFREIRQSQKEAQRRADALALKQGVDPAIIQNENSAFKKNIFKNAPIKRAGKIVAI